MNLKIKFLLLEKILANNKIIVGLTNSMGWRLNNIKLIHLFEPLTSNPTTKVNKSNVKEEKKRYFDVCLKKSSLNTDVKNIINEPKNINK